MNIINVKNSTLKVPEIALGCMRISDMTQNDLNKLITTSLDNGINFFDHADIYGGGKSEEIFGKTIKELKVKREDIMIQSKAGIRDGFFDFSKEHIINSVDKILKRLNTDYLDCFLLHRPDTLMEPAEVADAFDSLEKSGKVKYFGVSNQNPMQIELLKRYVNQDLLFNQLQLSLKRTGMIDAGLNVNMKVDSSVNHDGYVLDYCRLNNITIQAWSPFQYGFFEGVFLNNQKFPELNSVIDRLAEKYSVTNSAIAVSWILRHPARIQTIIGTTNPKRVEDMSKAADFTLTREEWYELYRSAGNVLP
ncbi:aldo/keto reductase family oxidoreductase [Thiospirochaeta perfilievii]|uniref:Aldo/keto reductase family oxidoreductase n=1 Tax=Thiospirochaeta perfilievii TaxID=252967 RepID=A0A5C1QCQ2_9SPIO|nr:aldo/keto reductase [Thiospirochaeta perfilievii]QEN04456.1 aldo/keto reductase family oxidoreductase [Thiospirochaeta perfilievii]